MTRERGEPAERDQTQGHCAVPARWLLRISAKGYDKLDSKQLMPRLHGCSQAELDAVGAYERSHLNRVEVLNKLRYMSADMPTIKAVRAYERKFAHRPEVVEFVAGLHRERLANTPKKPVPAYQAGGGSHDKLK